MQSTRLAGAGALSRGFLLLAGLGLGVGCGADAPGQPGASGSHGGRATTATSSVDTTSGGNGGNTADASPAGNGQPTFDGRALCGADDATITGRVLSPSGHLPIPGARVYLTAAAVSGVPDGAYCARCPELDCPTRQTRTEADGTFRLPAAAGPGQQLVVEKGQFLRLLEVDVVAGSQALDEDRTRLPGRWDPASGLWIPRILVYETTPDRVYNALARFGLGEVGPTGELVQGTEAFDMLDPTTDRGEFLDDAQRLAQYHIVFLPCAATKYFPADTGFWGLGGSGTFVSPRREENIREFVAAGGKLYATDHSNEYISEPFPDYQTFHQPGAPDLSHYDTDADVIDSSLLAWLESVPAALVEDAEGGLAGLPTIPTTHNYSAFDAVHSVTATDDSGMPVEVGHHVWVEGPCAVCSDSNAMRPMAVTGQYGCGRMMFSTFETSSAGAELGAGGTPTMTPQELVLLYMILEMGECRAEPPPEVPILQ